MHANSNKSAVFCSVLVHKILLSSTKENNFTGITKLLFNAVW